MNNAAIQFKSFHHYFEDQAKLYSELTAIVEKDAKITYSELNKKASELSKYLKLKNLPFEAKIGILLNSSIDYVCSMLAVLKAGYCFVPLDPNLPLERLKYYIENSQVSLLITRQHEIVNYKLQNILENSDFTILDNLNHITNEIDSGNLNLLIEKNQLAYIIYTSGSTGTPKGVAIEHKGLPNCMQSAQHFLTITPEDRIALYAPISFDASIWQIMLALGAGATLYVIPPEIRLHSKALGEYHRNNKISVAVFPPSMFNELQPEDFKDVRVIVSTGEHVTATVLNKWYLADKLIINGYGPTEVTIATSLGKYIPGQAVHVGKPIAGLQAYILDNNLNLLGPGLTGELFLAGEGLARGYWGQNMQTLTNEKFISISPSLNDIPQEAVRVFRTHDLAEYTPERNIVIKGRVDRQVKIYGQLVSPEEIEKTVMNFSTDIRNVDIDIISHTTHSTRINAYLAVDDESLISINDLHSYLKNRLPHYMIPTGFAITDYFPLNHHGKIDKQILHSLPLKRISEDEIINPRDNVETLIHSIWSDVLDAKSANLQFGVTSKFNEIGGTSLDFLVLHTKIQEQFPQIELSLSEFMDNPTIAALSEKINSINHPKKLPVRPDLEDKPLLFFVHDITGNLQINDLRFHLGDNYPIYGLKAEGLESLLGVGETMDKLADNYIQTIRNIQQKGPYFLAGWSAGGIIAFELARHLLMQGEQVKLCMIDTISPHYLQNMTDQMFTQELVSLINELARIIGINLSDGFNKSIFLIPRKTQIDVAFDKLIEQLDTQKHVSRVKHNLAILWITRAKIIYNSINRYQHSNHALKTKTTIIVASRTSNRVNHPSLGWEIIDEDNVHTIDTDHFGIIRDRRIIEFII